MVFDFNVFSFILVFFGSLTLLLALYILNNEKGVVRWVGLLMLSNSIWSIGYGLELASAKLSQMTILVSIEYLGIASLPFNWFLFCLVLAGKKKWLARKENIVLISVIPLLSLILLWTNSVHHLFYTRLSVENTGGFPMLKIVPGIAYYVFAVYFYILLTIGTYILVKSFSKTDAVFRKQNRIIAGAAFIPWIANFTYMLGLRPMNNLDITPYAFLVAAFLIFLAIYRFDLFDTLPVARGKVLELMQDGFIVLDHRNRVIDHNSSFRLFAGINQKDEIMGQQLCNILTDQEELKEFLAAHKSGKLELVVDHRNGRFDLEADVMYLTENKLTRSATIIKFQDVTNIRQQALRLQHQTNELQTLNQLKDRVFSIMAHDLRGPLLNVAEVLKMISDDTITHQEFKYLSPKLTKDISYTADLLENILHWSRSQLKGYSINRGFCDVHALVQAEINYYFQSASDKNITIRQVLDQELHAYADTLMMQIILRNLIGNAIKFCHAECLITVAGYYDDAEFIFVSISDNGVGIAKEHIDRIFKGENISSRGTKNEKGTGIGLMVCWEFMERNGGKISLESELGKGTTFNMKIPRLLI